jgi:putative transposase
VPTKARYKRAVRRTYVVFGRRAGECSLWQRRYLEHTIRDERDMENHMAYIRGNPVRHGYVKQFEDWEHSSFYKNADK